MVFPVRKDLAKSDFPQLPHHMYRYRKERRYWVLPLRFRMVKEARNFIFHKI